MAADVPLGALRAEASRHAPDPPGLDKVIEDVGLERLAAYYLYSALLAGVIGDDDLAPERWPPELADPMRRLGLVRFAARTARGLDAQLTPAEQATRRSPARQLEFARLVVDLINQGALGPLCEDADSVRLAESSGRPGLDLELVNGRQPGPCRVEDHWELVARHLAGLPRADDPPAGRESARAPASKIARQLEETGISHAVSTGITLAVHVQPLGAVAGLGTRLVRSRIRAGREQADALQRLGQELHTLRAQAESELADLR